ncbi:glycoside hydrolase family 43 protein [Zasmidium cellare ATCC 36951]|uniref:Glycoside hydrolase family 43 protein n=1 Tax=Zasmidium cellare ATCC 36951 TaxID=1080233 RepID=A0A6A6CTC4_ZASCE|nr:glycoside hydrolase family 43 protein [Zasmidium cellare ATCC 36951]KAF2169410.1 glycoside hydrolase family 43 protein [Zasmidium cellare ATCC 36951]
MLPTYSMRAIVVALLLCASTALSNSNSTYLNPILPGFHPDPSCIFVPEVNHTFFCATSSFSLFPGIPIYASKDLAHWRLASHAISRPEQLPDLALTNGSTSGVWAPTIRYRDGTFYITSTLVFDDFRDNNASRFDNFIVHSKDPFSSSSWSDPVHFPFVGIDTSLFWDEDGATYFQGASPTWIKKGIYHSKIDIHTGALSGPLVNLWNGTGGNSPEGPHIYRKDGWYYLSIAEGGTGLPHEENVARSRSLDGPYGSYVGNPILTNANTSAYFQTVGHADIFQDAKGQWWAVALATRSGPEYTVYPMGRETILTPAVWPEGGWPRLSRVKGEMTAHQLPPTEIIERGEGQLIGERDIVDFTPGTSLPTHFLHWRAPVPENYEVSPPGHDHQLELRSSMLNLTGYDGNTTNHHGGLTFVARRQEDTLFTYSVDLEFSPDAEEQEAGVSIFLTQDHHYDLGLVLLPSANDSEALTMHLRAGGMSLRSTPETLIAMNSTWLGQAITLEIKAFNFTHYSLSAGPTQHAHLMQTIANIGRSLLYH